MVSVRKILALAGLTFAAAENGTPFLQSQQQVQNVTDSASLSPYVANLLWDADNMNERLVRRLWMATVSSKRKNGVSKEVFSRRFANHGKLAGPLVVKNNGISYIQHHLPDSYISGFKKTLGPENANSFPISDADGIITMTFPTVEDIAAFFKDDASLNADVAEYADTTSVQFSIGYELPVVENGKLLV